MTEALSIAQALNETQATARATFFSSVLARLDGNIEELDLLSTELIEISSRHDTVTWLPLGHAHRGWARMVLGDKPGGLASINGAISDYQKRGSTVGLPYLLALKAEALHWADRAPEALEVVKDAIARAERFGIRWWYAELLRFQGVFLPLLEQTEMKLGHRSVQLSEPRTNRSQLR